MKGTSGYWLMGSMLLALGAACGGEEDGTDLTPYAGQFAVTETFREQNGSSCPPATQPYENQVTVKIEKSQFEAQFNTKWSVLYGEIQDDGSFLAVDNEGKPDEALQLTGEYLDQDAFSGLLKEVWQGCTRWTNMQAERIPQE